ncbi:MAG: 3-oxoacyl-ACP synthase [Bacteroidia bacterium]|nr:3-oxoacyl-ACP synthase [Bacteroidia bacterium]
MIRISACATIRNYTVSRNGLDVLTLTGTDVASFADDAYRALNLQYPKYFKMDNLAKLGMLALEVLTQQQKLSERFASDAIGVVLANKSSSLDVDRRYFETTKQLASPALFVYTLANIVAGEMCIRHGIKGENAFFVMPEFDPVQLHTYVEMVFGEAGAEACVAGWVEVLGDQHDVFLYLAEIKAAENALPHTTDSITKLYRGQSWNN